MKHYLEALSLRHHLEALLEATTYLPAYFCLLWYLVWFGWWYCVDIVGVVTEGFVSQLTE